MENEITKEINIEHRFHRTMIGTKGEKIREIRDQYNQVRIASKKTTHVYFQNYGNNSNKKKSGITLNVQNFCNVWSADIYQGSSYHLGVRV